MFKDIAVCLDGSRSAQEAFDQAVELAKALEAPLRIVTAVPSTNPYYLSSPSEHLPDEEQVRFHWELAARAVEQAKARGLEEVGFVVLHGDPVDAILDYLEREPASLLFVGARGLSRTQRLLFGSVSSALVQQARCTVAVAKLPRATAVPRRAPATGSRHLRNRQGDLRVHPGTSPRRETSLAR